MADLFSRWRRDAHVGVAVGSNRLNLAKVVRRGGVFHVEGCASLPADRHGDLRTVVAEHGWRGLPATIAMRDQIVLRRELNLPPMGAGDLRKLIAREIAAEGREGRLAAWKVEPRDGGVRVALRAVERPLAMEWARRLRDAGLVPHHILARATAFANATLRPEDRTNGELISLLDVWERESDLVLVRNGEQIYHRHIGRGWDGTEFNTPQGAGAAGIAGGYGEVALAGAEAAAPPAGQPAPDAAPRGNWERLAEEVRRTHLYAKKNLQAGEVARAVLTGEADETRRQWLADAVGADVLTLAGYRADLVWDGEINPRHVLPVGAALRGFTRRAEHERLIPAEGRAAKAPATHAATAALGVCLFALALMGVYNQARAVSGLRGHVDMLRQNLERIEASHPGRKPPSDSPLEQALLNLPNPFPGSPLLAVLGRALPAGGRVTDLSAEWEGAWSLEMDGHIDGDPVTALRHTGRLIADLEASGLFHTVDLLPLDSDRPGRFRLRLTLEDGHGLPS